MKLAVFTFRCMPKIDWRDPQRHASRSSQYEVGHATLDPVRSDAGLSRTAYIPDNCILGSPNVSAQFAVMAAPTKTAWVRLGRTGVMPSWSGFQIY